MKEVDIRQCWRCIYTYMFVCLFVTHIYVLVLSANICVFAQRMFAWNGVNGRMRRKWTHTWEKPTGQKRLQVYVAKNRTYISCHNFGTNDRPYFWTMDPQQQNNGFGPLSKRRGKSATTVAVILVVVPVFALVITVIIAQDKKLEKDYLLFFINGTGRLLLSFVIGKLLQKICLFCEEVQHKETRYNGSLKKVLKSTFAFRFGDYMFFFLSVFLLVLIYVFEVKYTTFCHEKYFWLFCLNSCWVAMLSFVVG